MKQFISFVRKEIYHIARDKRTVLILLVMPVVQILLFGFAITAEVKNGRIAVFDPSQDASTQHIKERFRVSKYFTIVKELTNGDDVNDIFKSGEVDMVLVFSENFADNLLRAGDASVQLVADGSEPNQSSILVRYATNILDSYQQDLRDGSNAPLRIVQELRMLYNPQAKSPYNFVPGVMGLILILICAMMTSIAIVREKEMGTMEILLASPLKPIYIILAKAVPYFMLSVVNLITILLLSVYVLEVPIAGSLALLLFISFVFIFLSLSLGLLISTVADTQLEAMVLSGMGLMMPIILLSGMMFPIESMPEALQWATALVPARWYIEAIRKIMIQGVEVQYVAKELLILSVMAAVLILVSLKNFKRRLN